MTKVALTNHRTGSVAHARLALLQCGPPVSPPDVVDDNGESVQEGPTEEPAEGDLPKDLSPPRQWRPGSA